MIIIREPSSANALGLPPLSQGLKSQTQPLTKLMKNSVLNRTIHLVACFIALTSTHFSANAQLAIQAPRHVIGTGSNATPFLILEAENYISEADGDPTIGFIKVYNNEAITSSIGNPV